MSQYRGVAWDDRIEIAAQKLIVLSIGLEALETSDRRLDTKPWFYPKASWTKMLLSHPSTKVCAEFEERNGADSDDDDDDYYDLHPDFDYWMDRSCVYDTSEMRLGKIIEKAIHRFQSQNCISSPEHEVSAMELIIDYGGRDDKVALPVDVVPCLVDTLWLATVKQKLVNHEMDVKRFAFPGEY